MRTLTVLGLVLEAPGMIPTTTFGQPKSSITSQGSSASQLSSSCQYLLPKRTAEGLSHRLWAPALLYWGMSLTLRHCMLREVLPPQYDIGAGKP